MKLYQLWQNVNNEYDTFSDCVVAAETAAEAQRIHPKNYWRKKGSLEDVTPTVGECKREEDESYSPLRNLISSWACLDAIHVEEIGTAVEGMPSGVICVSYHAG